MFYDYLDSLCAEQGMSVTELMKLLGISPSSASRWKNKGYEPSRAAAKQIADYFEISVAELLSGGKTKTAPAEVAETDEVAELLEEIRRKPGMRTLFSLGKNATPEQLRTYIDVIKAMGGQEFGGDDY